LGVLVVVSSKMLAVHYNSSTRCLLQSDHFPPFVSFPPVAPWAAPLGLIGAWAVYPGLTEEFKKQIGLEK